MEHVAEEGESDKTIGKWVRGNSCPLWILQVLYEHDHKGQNTYKKVLRTKVCFDNY